MDPDAAGGAAAVDSRRGEAAADGPGRGGGGGPARPRGRRLLFAALAVVLSVGGTLLLLEGALRVLGYDPAYVNPLGSFHVRHPRIGWRGKPGFSGRFVRPQFAITIRHDARGFRAGGPPPPPDPDWTLHLLGDSFAWGWGVEGGEMLSARLAERLPRVRVLNRGISATGTSTQYELFRSELAPEVAPGDVVLVLLTYNDLYDNLSPKRPHAGVTDEGVRHVVPEQETGGSLKDWLKDHSHLANFLIFRVDVFRATRRARRREPAAPGALPKAAGPETAGFRAMRFYLGRLRAAAAARGARLAVVVAPAAYEMREAVAHAAPAGHRKTVLDAARAAGVTVLDPLPAFWEAREAAGVPFYYEHDGHWTPVGNDAMAAILAPALEALGKGREDAGG
jgi:lysophospholipase L1-like esterase